MIYLDYLVTGASLRTPLDQIITSFCTERTLQYIVTRNNGIFLKVTEKLFTKGLFINHITHPNGGEATASGVRIAVSI